MANLYWENRGIVDSEPEGGWPAISGAGDIPPVAVWRRLENWTGRFLVKRPVTMVAIGPGVLRREGVVFADAYERWDSELQDFVPATDPLRNGTLHRKVPDGRYRFSGVAGFDLNAFPEITYAASRFAEHLAAVMKTPEGAPVGAESYSISLGGDVSESWRRGRSAVANALYDSGAADLLRPFRRQKGERYVR